MIKNSTSRLYLLYSEFLAELILTSTVSKQIVENKRLKSSAQTLKKITSNIAILN